MALPTINNTNPYKIHDFYERLIANINTLDTMGKLKEINGCVRFALDNLCGIRADLVRTDNTWQNWGFHELTEAIRKWTERNPIERLERSERPFKEQHRGKHNAENTKTRKQENASIVEAKITNQYSLHQNSRCQQKKKDHLL